MNTAYQSLKVSDIGSIACQVLNQAARSARPGTVMGVTSRGDFVLFDERWVVFFSREPYRGPLTVNLRGSLDLLQDVEVHAAARWEGGELLFPQAGLSLTIPDGAGWKAPEVRLPPLPGEERLARLKAVANSLCAQKAGAGFSSVLARLLGVDLPVPWTPDHVRVMEIVTGFCRGLASGESQTVVDGLASLIGWGTGLTPSGDDLTSGLMLAVTRWKEASGAVLREDARSALVEQAYRRTTTLSANLVECAALGEADERLVDALDGIVTGIPDVPACVEKLATWGNSSGADALLGYTLGLFPDRLALQE